MKIELIKQEELLDGEIKLWWIVEKDGIRKHFHTEETARDHYAKSIEFHKKHGTFKPVEETILSETIEIPSNEPANS